MGERTRIQMNNTYFKTLYSNLKKKVFKVYNNVLRIINNVLNNDT